MDEHGPSTSWTESDDGPWSFVINGQRWTVDEHGTSTSWTDSNDEPLKIWKCERKWTDGRKSVRGGLVGSHVKRTIRAESKRF